MLKFQKPKSYMGLITVFDNAYQMIYTLDNYSTISLKALKTEIEVGQGLDATSSGALYFAPF